MGGLASEVFGAVEMLETFLGHPLAQASPAQIADLRTIYKSIYDGNSTWAEYVAANGSSPDAEDLKQKTQQKAQDLKDKLTKPAESETPPPQEPIDEFADLRNNVKDLFSGLDKKQQKDLLAGKPTIAKMNGDELKALQVEIEKVSG
jgi:hypothetical protein